MKTGEDHIKQTGGQLGVLRSLTPDVQNSTLLTHIRLKTNEESWAGAGTGFSFVLL